MWKEASERESDESAVPDGKYEMRLAKMTVEESRSSGRVQIHVEAIVTEGDYKGEHKHTYLGLESEDNMFYTRKALKRLGVEELPEEKPADLEEICATLSKEKPKFRATLITKGDYQNLYVDKLLSDEEAEEDEDEDEEKSAPKNKDEDEDEDKDEDEEVEPKKVKVSVGTIVKTPKGPGTIESTSKEKQTAIIKLRGGKLKEFKVSQLKLA